MIDQDSGPEVRGKSRFSRTTERHDVPSSPELERVQEWLLRYSVEHLHGPEKIEFGKEELVVVCLMRNGRQYVKSFVEHYSSLGAKHLVFLDNGSDDGTVEALRGYENVTVLQTKLPYRRYQVLMKKYLIERFGRGRWSLYVDIDELFDYPYSDIVSLGSLLRYLNERSYTAVVSYMLDMFSDEPLSDNSESKDLPVKELNRFYDVSNTRAYDYDAVGDIGNVLANDEIGILQGGVQGTLFSFYPLLIKHPLVFLDDKLKPMDLSDHWAGNARVADFTGVLFHYKLLGSLYGLVRREIEERNYPSRSGKYERYRKVLEKSPNLSIRGDTSKELGSVNDLVGTQFVVVSEEYMKFVDEEARNKEVHTQDGGLGRMAEPFFRATAEAKAQSRRAEQLRQQAKELEKENQKLKAHASKVERLESKCQNLEAMAEERAQIVRRLRKRGQDPGAEIRRLQRRVRDLEQEVRAIRASRSWKVLTALRRIRARVMGRKPEG